MTNEIKGCFWAGTPPEQIVAFGLARLINIRCSALPAFKFRSTRLRFSPNSVGDHDQHWVYGGGPR